MQLQRPSLDPSDALAQDDVLHLSNYAIEVASRVLIMVTHAKSGGLPIVRLTPSVLCKFEENTQQRAWSFLTENPTIPAPINIQALESSIRYYESYLSLPNKESVFLNPADASEKIFEMAARFQKRAMKMIKMGCPLDKHAIEESRTPKESIPDRPPFQKTP